MSTIKYSIGDRICIKNQEYYWELYDIQGNIAYFKTVNWINGEGKADYQEREEYLEDIPETLERSNNAYYVPKKKIEFDTELKKVLNET